jgi:formylglycine-generating enzyme required for sulfatase activity
LTRRQSAAARVLATLGKAEWVWPLLRRSEDPGLRTSLIHELSLSRREWTRTVVARLNAEADDSTRQALILHLGEHLRSLGDDPYGLFANLSRGYRRDPDPGVHSAIDWMLRRQEQGPTELAKADEELVSTGPLDHRRWYVNGRGHTLAVVRAPVEFLMGSPDREPGRVKDAEALHRRRIPRSFAIATREVTVGQFKRFLQDHPSLAPNHPALAAQDASTASSVTWFEAVQYCRWLSEQERVPEQEMCYPPVAEIEKAKTSPEGLKLPADYLSRTGYRLATEAEWECACRAGTTTSRPWGPSLRWADGYASCRVCLPQGLFPVEPFQPDAQEEHLGFAPLALVGQLKPNDLGLFDMLGNVSEWCQDRYLSYPQGPPDQVHEDREDAARATAGVPRVVRGGNYNSPAEQLRSAFRVGRPPADRTPTIGFRIARTQR